MSNIIQGSKSITKTPYRSKVDAVNQPFTSKILSDGSKIFTRIHGLSSEISSSPKTIEFNIPYANCKLNGIEIIDGATGDSVNLKVKDTPTGTISGVAGTVLNQFGYNTYVGEGFYKYQSTYDADLIKDMKLVFEYSAAGTLPRTLYFNIFLHEVK